MVGRPIAVCVRALRAGDDPAALIRAPRGFDCTRAQTDLGGGDYWVVSQDINERSRAHHSLTVRFASLWQTRIDLRILYADGRVHHIASDPGGLTKFIQLGAVAEYPLPHRRANIVRLMWKVEGAANTRGILVGARIATDRQSSASNLAMAAVYSAFGGLAIALLVYNLALWVSLRHRFQLAYCLMIAALMAYAFTSSGALAWAVPDIANNDRLRLNYLLLSLACAAALFFARTFFEDHVFSPALRRLVVGTGAVLLVTGIGFFALAPIAIFELDRIYTWTFAAMIVATLSIMWSAWRTRSNFLWLFAIAWAAPIVTAGMRVFASLRIIPWNFWIDNSTLLSMAAEALLSAVAIAYRIRLLAHERDVAVAAETVARRLADMDPLTGLFNRRAFLARAIGRAGEQKLLILDLDHFKQVNETLGHDGGDEVLRAIARAMRALAPADALVARIGGEEFALLADPAHPIDPNALLARVRATRMPFDLPVTASIGSATGPIANEADWKALYRAADRALFDAKSAGRDRSRSAPLAA
ncbi:MAG: diguanylate cyclase [Sphingomonas sp.]|nr:diguanylate cyclase [Sphingomonas sp.]